MKQNALTYIHTKRHVGFQFFSEKLGKVWEKIILPAKTTVKKESGKTGI